MIDIGPLSGPILLFGGPYSNVQATLAMRAEAERLGIQPGNVICNGDLVAYCADPEDTVNLIREWGIHVVMGNCEESIAADSDDCGCGFDADTMCSLLSREWYAYTRERISGANRRWMNDLPRSLAFSAGSKQFIVVHGSPDNISEFVFASTDAKTKQDALAAAGFDCLIGGHCGIPFGQKIVLEENSESCQFWLNTGVIGMPANDGTRDGWYMLIAQGEEGVTSSWHRLAFDSQAAARSMQLAGLSAPYQEALVTGRWPSLDVLPEAERAHQGQRLDPASMVIS